MEIAQLEGGLDDKSTHTHTFIGRHTITRLPSKMSNFMDVYAIVDVRTLTHILWNSHLWEKEKS